MALRAIVRRVRAIKRFTADRRASVSVDFIVSMPILLAVLVLTSEYGRVLQMRTALDNAVADATRYLSRVPCAQDPCQSFDQLFIDRAEQLVSSRINTRHLAISAPIVSNAGGVTTVQLQAAAAIASPALAVLSVGSPSLRSAQGDELKEVEGLVIFSSDTARHFGR